MANFLIFLIVAPPLAILAGWLGLQYMRYQCRVYADGAREKKTRHAV